MLLSITRTSDDLYAKDRLCVRDELSAAFGSLACMHRRCRTLIADEKAFDLLPPEVVEVVTIVGQEPTSDRGRWQRWSAMQVASGGSGFTGAGALSGPLAAAGITIFYLSTAEEDILLVLFSLALSLLAHTC